MTRSASASGSVESIVTLKGVHLLGGFRPTRNRRALLGRKRYRHYASGSISLSQAEEELHAYCVRQMALGFVCCVIAIRAGWCRSFQKQWEQRGFALKLCRRHRLPWSWEVGFRMMTVHVLHAGDGYTYLTRQVASGDVARRRGEALTDCCTAQGNPPGRWVGSGRTAWASTARCSRRRRRRCSARDCTRIRRRGFGRPWRAEARSRRQRCRCNLAAGSR